MKRVLIILSSLFVLIGVVNATPAAPDSTENCSPVLTKRVCIVVEGSGLHVDNFIVKFHAVNNGVTTKVKFAVRLGGPNGAFIEGPTATKTYVEDGEYHQWIFASNTNFVNNSVVCGEVIHVSGTDYSTNRPCATIHS